MLRFTKKVDHHKHVEPVLRPESAFFLTCANCCRTPLFNCLKRLLDLECPGEE